MTLYLYLWANSLITKEKQKFGQLPRECATCLHNQLQRAYTRNASDIFSFMTGKGQLRTLTNSMFRICKSVKT